jgi:hypothetical protein
MANIIHLLTDVIPNVRDLCRCQRVLGNKRDHRLTWAGEGPFFNDEFGDTFGNIYVLTGKDFDYALLKEYAVHSQSLCLSVHKYYRKCPQIHR